MDSVTGVATQTMVKPKRRRSLKRNLTGYLFLLPWLIGFFCMAIGPILASLYLSFTNYNMLKAPAWIGLQNFTEMFTGDATFTHSLKLTFQYVFLSVPLRLVFALAVAIILNKGLRLLGLYRTVYYIPSLLGGSVAIAVVWKKSSPVTGCLTGSSGFFILMPPIGWPIRATLFIPSSRCRFGNLARRW